MGRIRILKSRVAVFGWTTIETGSQPRFLTAGAQGNDVVVWYEAAIGKGFETRVCGIFTGEDIPDGYTDYIGTAQLSDGIVVHAYSGGTSS